MLWDTHMHTNFSGDSDATPESMVKAALQHGLDGVCITDHEDIDYPYDDPGFEIDDPGRYYKTIYNLQEKYHGQIEVLCGVEIGLQPHLKREFRKLTDKWPFDFVIASSHVIHRQDPYYKKYFEGRSEREALEEYFSSILENLEIFEDFDVYGHLDYVVRYSPNRSQNYSYDAYREPIDAILNKLIDMGKGIEVNTSGWKYGLSHPHPTEAILHRYHELGGEILTLGSDAHQPEHVAYDFHRLPDLLKSCGFSHYTVFRERQPLFLPLP